jgi:hypothetical protein
MARTLSPDDTIPLCFKTNSFWLTKCFSSKKSAIPNRNKRYERDRREGEEKNRARKMVAS